jgi:hypothetical protein
LHLKSFFGSVAGAVVPLQTTIAIELSSRKTQRQRFGVGTLKHAALGVGRRTKQVRNNT